MFLVGKYPVSDYGIFAIKSVADYTTFHKFGARRMKSAGAGAEEED